MTQSKYQTHHADYPLLKQWPGRKVFTELFTKEEQSEIAMSFWEEGDVPDECIRALTDVFKARPQAIRNKTPEDFAAIAMNAVTHQSIQPLFLDLLAYHYLESDRLDLRRFLANCFPFDRISSERDSQDWKLPALPDTAIVVDLFMHTFGKQASRHLARFLLSLFHLEYGTTPHHYEILEPIILALLKNMDQTVAETLEAIAPHDPQPTAWYRFAPPLPSFPSVLTPLDRYLFRRRHQDQDNLKDVIASLERDYVPNRPATAFLRGALDVERLDDLDHADVNPWYWIGMLWTCLQEERRDDLALLQQRHTDQVAPLFETTPPNEPSLLLRFFCYCLDTKSYDLAWRCLHPWLLATLPQRAVHALINLLDQLRQRDPHKSEPLRQALLAHIRTIPTEQHTIHFRLLQNIGQPMLSNPHETLVHVTPTIPPVNPWLLPTPVGAAKRWHDIVLPQTRGTLPVFAQQLRRATLPEAQPNADYAQRYRTILETLLDPNGRAIHQECLQLIEELGTITDPDSVRAWQNHLYLYAALSAYAGLDAEACELGHFYLQQIMLDRPLTTPDWLLANRLDQLAQLESPGLPGLLDWCYSNSPAVSRQYYRHFQWLVASPIARAALKQEAESPARPTVDRWQDWRLLLKASIDSGDVALMQEAIDRLIEWGQTPPFRESLLGILENQHDYDPALDQEEATSLRIQLLEQATRFHDAIPLVRDRFHTALSRGELSEAEGYLERLESYPGCKDLITVEQERWAAIAGQDLHKSAPMIPDHSKTDKRPISILLIGGNEIQARYDEYLKQHFAQYPNLRFQIIHTDWVVKWNTFWDRHREQVRQADWVVLLTMMRTDLHKKLREHTEHWISCTGRGRSFIQRKVEEGIHKAMAHRSHTKTS